MRLLTDQQALPHPHGSMVCRQSRAIAVSAVVVFLGITATLAWAIQTGKLPAFFWISVVLFGLIFVPISYSQLKRCMRRSNWTLRIDQRSVLVRFRSPFRPSDPGDVVAVELRFDEITSAQRRRVIHRSDDPDEASWKEVGVVLNLAAPTPELNDALDLDRASNTYKGKRIRSRTSHYPCTLLDESTLFVRLTGKYDYNRPRPNRVLRRLGEFVEVGAPIEIDRGDRRASDPDNPEAAQALEDEILELVASGNKITAIKRVRERYGYSLSEAKRLVEDLGGEPRDPSSLRNTGS